MTVDNLIPLTAIRSGQRVRVIRVGGGRGLRGRLYAMGLTPGTPVEVVCFSSGPVVLNVMGGRLMIGRGMAANVMVRKA
ncbi:MAG: FeoA family protein [Alphaproteobacteria bacterium]